MARPAPIFESPLVTWQPGDAAPDFGKISYRCQARWRSRPARQCVVWLVRVDLGGPAGHVARKCAADLTERCRVPEFLTLVAAGEAK